MKQPDETLYTDLVQVIRNSELPNLFDVELNRIDRLKDFHSFEFHFVLYPYSRSIDADNFAFNPFEEYVNDIRLNQKSAYSPIKTISDKIFGLILGFILFIVFYIFKPSDLYSVQSVVSVIGAYAIGKEIWDDIESGLSSISETWKIRYMELYYRFKLERNTTQSRYTQYAKKRRYGKSVVLPGKIDFIQLSNSQTLRMYFQVKNFAHINDPSSHVLSFRVDTEVMDDFTGEGFGIGVKVSFNKRFFGINRCIEIFQSTDKDAGKIVKGCLDEKGEWLAGALFYRKTVTLGRLKYFSRQDFLHSKSLVKIDWND